MKTKESKLWLEKENLLKEQNVLKEIVSGLDKELETLQKKFKELIGEHRAFSADRRELWMNNACLLKEYDDLQKSKHNIRVECETYRWLVKTLNVKLLKDVSLKGQPHNVIKLHEAVDALKKNLANFFLEDMRTLTKVLLTNIAIDTRVGSLFMMIL